MSLQIFIKHIMLLVTVVCCTCGCSRVDLYTVVDDTRGVGKDSPVFWQQKQIGQVSEIKSVEDGVRLDVKLESAYRKQLRIGVRACPFPKSLQSKQPALFLIGGQDTSQPLLERGAFVMEAPLVEGHVRSFWDWFKGSYWQGRVRVGLIGCLAALAAAFIAIWFLKRVLKIVLLIGAIIVIGLLVYSIGKEWKLEQISSITSADVKQWIQENKQWITDKAQQVGDQAREWGAKAQE